MPKQVEECKWNEWVTQIKQTYIKQLGGLKQNQQVRHTTTPCPIPCLLHISVICWCYYESEHSGGSSIEGAWAAGVAHRLAKRIGSDPCFCFHF